jgi:DNA-binding MarR family transcriptional regulator
VTPLERSITYRLHTLHKLTDRVSQTAYLAGTGLPMSEGRCLSAIAAFTPLSVNALAQRANLTKGQASRAAQSLVARGLVGKAANKTDARGVTLTLTARGKRANARVMAVVLRRNREIMQVLSPGEQRLFSDLLDRLVTHAKAAAGE